MSGNGYSSMTLTFGCGSYPASLDRQKALNRRSRSTQPPGTSFNHRGQGRWRCGRLQKEPTRHIAAEPYIEDIYGHRCHMKAISITGCVMEEVEVWRKSSAPVVLSICFRRLHLAICCARSMASSRWPPMSCLLCDVNGCKDVLGLSDQRDGRGMPDADLRRAGGLGR